MDDEGLQPVPDDLGFAQTIRGFAPGQKLFNRYTLGRIVGRGGMGLVWLARDEELGEDIALKFLPEVVRLDATSLEELKRETRRSRKLAHANIVKVYDFVSDGSSAAISMEFVDGDSLSGLRARQPHLCFEVREIEDWIRQLLNALVYAHEGARIVHRDLKPANVMVDREGQVKVTDFGISSSISESVSRVTVQRGTSGTLAYMSPQQAMGAMPSAQDDIYSLGAMLYELLTSKPPFTSSSSVAMLAQLREVVPPPMMHRRAELGIEGEPIPEAWEQTIAACLAKEAGQRPQTMAEVAEWLGLRPAMVTTAVPVTPPPTTKTIPLPEPPSPKRTGKGGLIAALVALALLLGGIGYYFGIYIPQEQAREAAIAQQEALEKEKEAEAETAADAVKKAQLEADAQKAAEAAEALRTQQEQAEAEKEKQAQAAAAEAERLANARGGLMVKTDPEGATVTLGGTDVQTSPATFKDEKLGTYPIHITLDGYEPVDQTAEIKENEFTDLGTIALPHSKGSLQITTAPTGLDYTISQNGTVVSSGQTPATVRDLPTGSYDVSIKKGDWELKNSVTIQRNETATYTPDFSTGSFSITSDPPGASVTANGQDLGKTPLVLNNLRPGYYVFGLTFMGYNAASVTGVVKANDTQAISAKLEKIMLGSARVTSEPTGATVSEHGNELGQTPLTLNELSLGSHTFRFALSGYKSSSATAQITPDTVSDISATLEKTQGFAGTWSGIVNLTASNGGSTTTKYTWVVSPDETSIMVLGAKKEPPCTVQREGDTLTWSHTTLSGGGGSWNATFSLRLLGDGKAYFVENENCFAGESAGASAKFEGTLTKQ
jgi:serine/threonine protein kinase